MKNFLNKALTIAMIAAGLVCANHALAQTYPSKPVKLIVPYPAGAPVDNFARGLTEGLTKLWGQQVIIESKPGANEIIAASSVTQAAPDGYTLLLGSDAAFTQNAFLYSKMPYNAEKDLTPITRAVQFNMVLITRTELKTPTLKDFVAVMKKEGAKHNYASAGAGGTTHLAMESLKQEAGFDMVHVPYKSSSVARTDLISGQVDLMIDGIATMKPFVESGRIRALGVTSSGRNVTMPQVPPVVDAVPGFVEDAWVGMMAPAGTPQVAVERLSTEITKLLANPEIRKFYADQGTISQGSTPIAFGAVIKADIDKWAQVIKVAKVKVD